MPKNLPEFATFSECKRLVTQSWANKSLRPGQSLSHKFDLPERLETLIYEETSLEKVIQKVWNFSNNTN